MKKVLAILAALSLCAAISGCAILSKNPAPKTPSLPSESSAPQADGAASGTTADSTEAGTASKAPAATGSVKAPTTTGSPANATVSKAPSTAITMTPNAPAPVSSSAGGMTMAQYIASLQSQIETMQSGLESAGMKMTVTARGNSLVYSYQYLIDIGDISIVKPSLEQALNAASPTFTAILSTMKIYVPGAESIIVEYLSKDGTLICSKEFK